MGLVSETRDTLGSLAGVLELLIDRAALENVVGDLNKTIDDLDAQAANLLEVGGTSFGGSGTAALVHHHSSLAYDAVMDALGALNTGMQHYVAALKGLEKDADSADEAAGAVGKSVGTNVDAAGRAFRQGSGEGSGS